MIDIVVDGVPMTDLADVSGIRWGTRWETAQPGGCDYVQWSMDLPPRSTVPVLRPGAPVMILDGPTKVFAGVLSEPARDHPWQLHARGLSSLAVDYLCLDAGGGTTSIPDAAIHQAIVRGLPWLSHPGGLYMSTQAFTSAETTVDLNRLDALLNAWCQQQGRKWAVWTDGDVISRDDPTSPMWLLDPPEPLVGVADDDFYTHLFGRHVSAVTGTPPAPSGWATVTVGDNAAAARWGRREAKVDLTPLGLMNFSVASQHISGRFAQIGARMGWTAPLDVTTDGAMTALDGTPARLSMVRAGQMVRVFSVTDATGNLRRGSFADIVIGRTDYSVDDAALVISPVGLVERDLAGALATPDAPAEEFTDDGSV